MITLGEGQTPLVKSRSIGPSLGLTNLHFKLEHLNPTGSYKDRFAAAAVSRLADDRAPLCLGCSSGNTGAALAAYSAAVGIPCILAIVDSAPGAKLRQMQVYGATLIRLRGFGVDAEATQTISDGLSALASRLGTTVQISAFRYSPVGMEGVQSIATELAESGLPIDHVFCPAGAGGLTLAVARGFAATDLSPAVHCIQPVGNDTIATPLREGRSLARAVDCTTTISGLQVANVMDGNEVVAACRASGGTGFTVTDDEVFATQRRLTMEEGIFCEPAGAVATAGVIKAVQEGTVGTDAAIASLITGSGFKDEASFGRMVDSSTACRRVDTFEAFEQIVLENLGSR